MHLLVRDCQTVSGITAHIRQKPFQALVAPIEMALQERCRILRRGGFGYFRVGAKFIAIETVAGAFPRRPNLQRPITEIASHREAPNSLRTQRTAPRQSFVSPAVFIANANAANRQMQAPLLGQASGRLRHRGCGGADFTLVNFRIWQEMTTITIENSNRLAFRLSPNLNWRY
jgi:hypothetical protein